MQEVSDLRMQENPSLDRHCMGKTRRRMKEHQTWAIRLARQSRFKVLMCIIIHEQLT